MEKQYLVRKAAIKLLEELYFKSDCYLKGTVNVSEMISDKMDKLTFQKAGQYLIKKKLVETGKLVADEWTATITYLGIDWLEDCHNINPCD